MKTHEKLWKLQKDAEKLTSPKKELSKNLLQIIELSKLPMDISRSAVPQKGFLINNFEG